VLSVGLAFAAWASLMDGTGLVRWLFALVAALVLVVCLCFLGIHFLTQEPIPDYLSFLDNAVCSWQAG
jgi:hypothetical protein